jgi:integrase
MNDCKQLWTFTDGDCSIPFYLSDEEGIKKRICKKALIMNWPDGSVCWPVTQWLLSKYKELPITRARRGSAVTYASLITPLVRFVYNKRLVFTELIDDHMYEWADSLRNEEDLRSKLFKRRKNSQTRRIMRKGLDFLLWFQKHMLLDKIIVGTDSCYSQIIIAIKKGKRGKFVFEYLDHPAIPKDNVPEDVKPVGHNIITKLYDAIPISTKNKYVQKRRQQLLRVLEASGGRRLEVSQIKTSDIEEALQTERLSLHPAKTQSEELRKVPISRDWIEPIIVFINTHRKQLIKKLKETDENYVDPGYLFLSEIDGNPINEETITTEISILRKIAGIDEKVCAHMFRHRFITLQVIYRLKEYIGKDLPLDIAHVILTKVASITGHKRIESLIKYFDLAFEEMGVWDTAEKVIMLRSKAEAAFRNIQILTHDVREGKNRGIKLINHVSEILATVINNLNDINTNNQGMLQV